MGECGCGDMQIYKPLDFNGDVLGVELYDGCQDCGTGLMVTLYKFTPEEAQSWGVEPEDVGKFDQFGMVNIPIMGVDDLIEAYQELVEEQGKEPLDEYENFADWLHDNGLRLLQGALWKRINKNREEERKQKGKDQPPDSVGG